MKDNETYIGDISIHMKNMEAVGLDRAIFTLDKTKNIKSVNLNDCLIINKINISESSMNKINKILLAEYYRNAFLNLSECEFCDTFRQENKSYKYCPQCGKKL